MIDVKSTVRQIIKILMVYYYYFSAEMTLVWAAHYQLSVVMFLAGPGFSKKVISGYDHQDSKSPPPQKKKRNQTFLSMFKPKV